MLLIFLSLILSLHRSSFEDSRLRRSFNSKQYNRFLARHTGTSLEVINRANRYDSKHPSKYHETISDRTKIESVAFLSTPESCPDTEYGIPVWDPPDHEVSTNSCMAKLKDTLTRQNLLAASRPAIRGYQPIHGFFHITLNVTTFFSRQENETIFETQLQKLDKSGLLEESSLTLRIGLHDTKVNNKRTLCVKEAIERRVAVLAMGAKIEWVNPSKFECNTILYMQKWCNNNKKSYVYYLHNKGFTHLRDRALYLNVKSWREFMMFFLFERWTLCANSLARGAATCGVHINFEPYMHYQGNFWWSSCNHMVRVTSICPPGLSFRHAAEFWLMANTEMFNDTKEVVELWYGNPSFFHPYPRDEYSCVDWLIKRKQNKRQNTLD